MTEDQRERLLRDALEEAHRSTRRRTPGFALLWSRAAAQANPARIARGRRLTVAAAGAGLTLALAIGLWIVDRQTRAELENATAMATTFSEWQAPLDYLLATPGQEWLETSPRLDVGLAAEPWNVEPDLLQEVPQ